MDQETRWLTRYNEVKEFIEREHRNPSKYVDAERGLRNWVKQQKKLMNAGALEGQRLRLFNELLALGDPFGARPQAPKVKGGSGDLNVKNRAKERNCSKNIWRFETKMLPLHHISRINNC